jgi:hypothetical protein
MQNLNSDVGLTAEQIAGLDEARKAIPKVREQLRKAKLAGLDVSAQEKELSDLEQQIGKLYAVYGKA